MFCVLSFLCSLFSAARAGFSLRLCFDLPEFHIHTEFCSYTGSSVTSRVEMGKLDWKQPSPSAGHSASVQPRSNPGFGQLELNERSCFFRSCLCSATRIPATSLSDAGVGWMEVTQREPWPQGDSLAPSPNPSHFPGLARGTRAWSYGFPKMFEMGMGKILVLNPWCYVVPSPRCLPSPVHGQVYRSSIILCNFCGRPGITQLFCCLDRLLGGFSKVF